jgi:hypothetical protein
MADQDEIDYKAEDVKPDTIEGAGDEEVGSYLSSSKQLSLTLLL